MRLVKQENKMGCGIACTAAVLGWPYKKILKLFPTGKADTKGFICKEIVKALKKSGLEYKYRYIKSQFRYRVYKVKTIVFIKRSKKYPSGHYLARSKNGWMDPWINWPDKNRKAGFRKKLPGHPIYLILDTGSSSELK